MKYFPRVLFTSCYGISFLILVSLSTTVLGNETLDRFLVIAAKQGSVSNVQASLKQGANPNYIEQVTAYGDGDSPLYCAVASKSTDAVRVLLAVGADPLQTPAKKPWMFALAAACQGDMTNKEILNLLLGSIKHLPAEDDRFTDWIICPAARRGDLPLLTRLEKLGVRLGAVSQMGNTLFISAAERGRLDEAEKWLNTHSKQYEEATNTVTVYEVIQYLIAHPFEEGRVALILEQAQKLGVTFTPKDKWNTPNWKLAAVCRLPDCARVLGCPPEEQVKIVRRSNEEFMLQAACNSDSLSVFTNLFDQTLHESGDRKMTASRCLLILLRSHQVHNYEPRLEALQFLRSQGADIEYEDETASPPTPLQAAVDRGNLEFIQWLMDEGADINHATKKSRAYALEWAVSLGKEDAVRWLFAHGARVQEQKSGRSLLTMALNAETLQESKSGALIQLLIKAGANPYIEHNEKKAAVDILAERHDIRRLRELDKKGVYRQLVNQYTPPANSPFVGVWWNGEGEFKTFSLILNDEGLAIVGTSITPLGFFPWRATETNHAVIELTLDRKRQDIVVEYLKKTNAIRILAPPELPSDLLRKQTEKPLKADEYRERLRGGAK